MDVSKNSLQESIAQYKIQLSQVENAIKQSSSPDMHSLNELRNDLEQLIELTQRNLDEIDGEAQLKNNSMDDEYALFMAEMNEMEDNKGEIEESENTSISINNDLKSLVGMQCSVYYELPWGGQEKHNAMICGVIPSTDSQSFNDISVRVLFTNPTCKKILPCPFFLDGECKFDDDRCHYSHGEIMPLSNIMDHVDPDFNLVKIGVRVLVKQTDKIWYPGRVESIIDESKDDIRQSNRKYSVILDKNKLKCEVGLEDILPQDNSTIINSDEETSSDSEIDLEQQASDDYFVSKSLMYKAGDQPLGEWEKHTRGIGSKLMQAMGYVVGCGLGSRGEGRVDPVPAVVLPSGKSLDHCMQLKEAAGGDENLFSVEKRLKRLQKNQEQQNKKAYERAVERENSNLFNFLNKEILSNKDQSHQANANKQKSQQNHLKTSSKKDLNVACLKISEEIRKQEKELLRYEVSLKRHSEQSDIYKQISCRIESTKNSIATLKTREKDVTGEQHNRRESKKLTIF